MNLFIPAHPSERSDHEDRMVREWKSLDHRVSRQGSLRVWIHRFGYQGFKTWVFRKLIGKSRGRSLRTLELTRWRPRTNLEKLFANAKLPSILRPRSCPTPSMSNRSAKSNTWRTSTSTDGSRSQMLVRKWPPSSSFLFRTTWERWFR